MCTGCFVLYWTCRKIIGSSVCQLARVTSSSYLQHRHHLMSLHTVNGFDKSQYYYTLLPFRDPRGTCIRRCEISTLTTRGPLSGISTCTDYPIQLLELP